MADETSRRRIALACQGGGSLTAFTAGVLTEILRQHGGDDIVAISGTSGGAMCAVLAWDGLVVGDEERAIENLQGFWRENSASAPMDRWLNRVVVQYASVEESGFPTPEVSPYDNPFSTWGRRRLRQLLERYVDFEAAAERRGPVEPALYIGAVDITEDRFRVFDGSEVTADAVLASAAIPPLFPAIEIDGRLYWDGLLSENPPIGVLTDESPTEIWVVQVNSPNRPDEPRTLKEITDRRNELAGNLSLNQELDFVEKVNTMIADGVIDDDEYEHIEVERLVLDEEVGYAAKLDRDVEFIEHLFDQGVAVADAFLERRG